MLAKHYRSILIAKMAIGIVASIGFLWYYSISQELPTPAVVFVVDMQESMHTQDIADGKLSYTRQQAAVQYIYHAIQSIDTGMDIGIVRLGYYPDYIVPLTRDRETIDSYVTSLANAPLSPTLVYQTGDISLKNYYTIAPTAKYILLTDKQSTIVSVQESMPKIQSILIDHTDSRASIQERDDVKQTISYRQGGHLGWIFVLITIVGLILL